MEQPKSNSNSLRVFTRGKWYRSERGNSQVVVKDTGVVRRLYRLYLACTQHYWELEIKIASLVDVPRATASWVSSSDQAKEEMRSDWKFVSCRGEPPSRGRLQRFETPLRFST